MKMVERKKKYKGTGLLLMFQKRLVSIFTESNLYIPPPKAPCSIPPISFITNAVPSFPFLQLHASSSNAFVHVIGINRLPSWSQPHSQSTGKLV
jgi:hypothetical protein